LKQALEQAQQQNQAMNDEIQSYQGRITTLQREIEINATHINKTAVNSQMTHE